MAVFGNMGKAFEVGGMVAGRIATGGKSGLRRAGWSVTPTGQSDLSLWSGQVQQKANRQQPKLASLLVRVKR